MKILVLGANGQLGGDVMAAAAGAPAVRAQAAGRAEVDVSDPAVLRSFLDAASFDALVNCTSYHQTDEVETQASRAMAVNAHAPAVMAEACAAKGARLLHISTDYVFGGDATRAIPLAETDPVAPVNVYGLSKAFGETLIGLAGGDATIFRVASLFGVRGASGKGGNFVETMIRVGREKGALRVVDDQIMSPTATAFVAGAIVAFLERAGPPGLYHCVNTGAVSWHAFAEAIVRGAKVPAEVAGCSSAEWSAIARRPAWSALDNTRLAAIVGPIPSWESALVDYLAAKGHA